VLLKDYQGKNAEQIYATREQAAIEDRQLN
jgi:hypothetical protein